MVAESYLMVVDKERFLEEIFDQDLQVDILVLDTQFVVDTEVDIGVDTVPVEVDIDNHEVAVVCFIKLEQRDLLVHTWVGKLAVYLILAFECFIIVRRT